MKAIIVAAATVAATLMIAAAAFAFAYGSSAQARDVTCQPMGTFTNCIRP